MDGNDIKPISRAVNQSRAFDDDGDGAVLRNVRRENAALILFRRVGRAFSDLGSMISRAFSNLADSFRGAFAHVSNMIRGVDRDTALRHVAEPRRDYSTRFFDLDEEESGDENFDANIGVVSQKNSANDKNAEKTDFSEMISPAVSQTSSEQIASVNAGSEASVPDLPLMNDGDSKAEIETSAYERVTPQKTNGEILFDSFHKLDSDKKSIEFLSPGSVYLQDDCLEFANKVINNTMAIEFGGKAEFTKDKLDSANALLKMKRQLDYGEQKRIKKEKELNEQKIIEQKKSSIGLGEWDFEEFLNDFISHQERREKFPIYPNGKYCNNPDLLEFAEKVESDINETDYRKQVATYLIRWNKYPEHAEKVTNEAVGFSLVPPPPPPPAPPPRKIQAPKVEPVPVPPEQAVIIELVNAERRHQAQLRGLIGFSESQMRSGLMVLARIWSSEVKDPGAVQPRLQAATADNETYTDLEEIDHAMKLVEAMAGMKTGHSFELSAAIVKIKDYRDVIIQKLTQQRSQIIGSRKISEVADLTEHQIVTGQARFEDFRNAFVSSSKRGALDGMIIRDIYFSDECVSYASYLSAMFPEAKNLVEKDQDSLAAAGYLLKKYHQFKALTNGEGVAKA